MKIPVYRLPRARGWQRVALNTAPAIGAGRDTEVVQRGVCYQPARGTAGTVAR